jgi:hypothetical protein
MQTLAQFVLPGNSDCRQQPTESPLDCCYACALALHAELNYALVEHLVRVGQREFWPPLRLGEA